MLLSVNINLNSLKVPYIKYRRYYGVKEDTSDITLKKKIKNYTIIREEHDNADYSNPSLFQKYTPHYTMNLTVDVLELTKTIKADMTNETVLINFFKSFVGYNKTLNEMTDSELKFADTILNLIHKDVITLYVRNSNINEFKENYNKTNGKGN